MCAGCLLLIQTMQMIFPCTGSLRTKEIQRKDWLQRDHVYSTRHHQNAPNHFPLHDILFNAAATAVATVVEFQRTIYKKFIQ